MIACVIVTVSACMFVYVHACYMYVCLHVRHCVFECMFFLSACMHGFLTYSLPAILYDSLYFVMPVLVYVCVKC